MAGGRDRCFEGRDKSAGGGEGARKGAFKQMEILIFLSLLLPHSSTQTPDPRGLGQGSGRLDEYRFFAVPFRFGRMGFFPGMLRLGKRRKSAHSNANSCEAKVRFRCESNSVALEYDPRTQEIISESNVMQLAAAARSNMARGMEQIRSALIGCKFAKEI